VTDAWESAEFWNQYGRDPYYDARCQTVLDIIPSDARSVLDVGSGRADISNRLPKPWRVVALDYALTPLRYSERLAVQGSVTHLPFPAGAFDLILCLEVLEHLPDADLRPAVAELQRVAREWLLVGVPFDEDLSARETRCPTCRHVFNADGHLRRFGAATDLERLLPEFRSVRELHIGHPIRQVPPPVRALARWMGVYAPWEPYFACPRCGFSDPAARARARWAHRVLRWSSRLRPARPYWVLCLLHRTQDSRASRPEP
jgi:hypothetical protein